MIKDKKNVFIILGILAILFIVLIRHNAIREEAAQSPMVTPAQAREEKNWESYEFPEVGLRFSAPFEMAVEGKKSDDTSFILTIQKGQYPDDDYYQLYGVYSLSNEKASEADLTSQLEPSSIHTSSISGFPAISGQYTGARNRLVTFIITDTGLLTLATSQPTKTNELLTSEILSTFRLSQ